MTAITPLKLLGAVLQNLPFLYIPSDRCKPRRFLRVRGKYLLRFVVAKILSEKSLLLPALPFRPCFFQRRSTALPCSFSPQSTPLAHRSVEHLCASSCNLRLTHYHLFAILNVTTSPVGGSHGGNLAWTGKNVWSSCVDFPQTARYYGRFFLCRFVSIPFFASISLTTKVALLSLFAEYPTALPPLTDEAVDRVRLCLTSTAENPV